MYIFLTLVTHSLITVMFHCVIKVPSVLICWYILSITMWEFFCFFFIVINHLRVSPGLPVVYHENYITKENYE